MKSKDFIAIAETAAMSFAAAAIIACIVWAFVPNQANAVANVKAQPKPAPTATTENGGVITGKITNPAPKSGEGVNLVMNLENPTKETVTLKFVACLDKQDAMAMLSRRVVLPKPGWKQTFTIKLEPGQKRQIDVASKVSLKPMERSFFYVMVGKKRTNFGVASVPIKKKAALPVLSVVADQAK